jgi:hypothetical protein
MGSAGREDSVVAARLVRLLRSPRSEHACAAAVVLGALRPRGPAAGRALARRLRDGDPIRPYVLDALARQRTEEALRCVVRALVEHGPGRDQARRLMKGFGARAFAGLESALVAAPGEAQVIYGTAAGFGTRAGVSWLMRRLRRASPAEARTIYLALRREMNAYPRGLRAHLRTAALALISPGARRSREAARLVLRAASRARRARASVG